MLLQIFLTDLDLSLRLDQLRPKERQWWAEQPAGTTAAQFCPWLTNEMNRKLMLTRTAVDKDVAITDCQETASHVHNMQVIINTKLTYINKSA